MKKLFPAFCLLFIVSCRDSQTDSESSFGTTQVAQNNQTLLDVRAGFTTRLRRQISDRDLFPVPPHDLFSLEEYETDLGPMNAMVSIPADESKKHAAIVWITGGFPAGGAGSYVWEPADSRNDQSARAYREQGIVMMYPALRGSCGNPGYQEGFLGEVNDVIAAAKFLQQLDYVDSDRIFLGGHSTGGTLALLVAESTDIFRGVISFGPVDDPSGYGPDVSYHVLSDNDEYRLRAPINFLEMIRTPTLIIEGTDGNIESLREMKRSSTNRHLTFIEAADRNHFDVLAPANQVLAAKIRALAPGQQLTLSASEISTP